MHKRSLLIILIIFFILPVFAGELENAFAKKDNVFLYLYSPHCRYCVKFNPYYEKLAKTYGNQYEFVKLDTSTYYGNQIFKTYNGRFVPYVLLLNQKKHKSVFIVPNCLTEYACINQEINKFKN